MPPNKTGSTSEEFDPISKTEIHRQDSDGYHSLSSEEAENNEQIYSSPVQPLIRNDDPCGQESKYSTCGSPPNVDLASSSTFGYILHHPHQSPPSTYITPKHESNKRDKKRKRYHNSTSSSSSLLSRMYSKSSNCCWFGLLMLVVDVVILVVGAVGVVILYDQYFDLNYKLNEMMKKNECAGEVCMPCGDLKVGIFEEDNVQLQFLIRKEVSGVEVCCAKTPEQTRIMFDLVSMHLLGWIFNNKK